MIDQQECQGFEELTQEEVDATLIELAKDGEVLAICPQCHIPMSYDELQALTCGVCGSTLEFKNISFQSTQDIPQG
jgi:exosome complex RNA-binding protein Csl4